MTTNPANDIEDALGVQNITGAITDAIEALDNLIGLVEAGYLEMNHFTALEKLVALRDAVPSVMLNKSINKIYNDPSGIIKWDEDENTNSEVRPSDLQRVLTSAKLIMQAITTKEG